MTVEDNSVLVPGAHFDLSCRFGVYSGLDVETSKFRVVKFGLKDMILKRATANECR